VQERAANESQERAAESEADHSFDAVLATYRSTFFKITSTFEADPDLQQDLLQEILLSVWQAMARFRGESSVKTYVYRVAYNRALNHVAKRSRLPKHEELGDAHARHQQYPESVSSVDRDIDTLMTAIRRLPVVQRQLVTLTLEGLSYAEISEITGLSVNNVGVRLNRAKKQLRTLMETNDDQR
jgi:RNA polymerase sigma factor (sigma-70 family)